ncbi:hypothetical protein MPER_07139, partial [Moniliophthora perniciosa FA553]
MEMRLNECDRDSHMEMMAHNDNDVDVPYGWNIDKLCRAAKHLVFVPEPRTFHCRPEIFETNALPENQVQSEKNWYLVMSKNRASTVREGIYDDYQTVKTLFSNDDCSRSDSIGSDIVLRAASSKEQAIRIWGKKCQEFHREDPLHRREQELSDQAAYSEASHAKARLVYERA